MDRCGTWTSSYRLVLTLLQEIHIEPRFDETMLVAMDGCAAEALCHEALWDVIFTRLSGLQEYGFHAGLESLMWATDSVNGGLSQLRWDILQGQLRKQTASWTREIIAHARAHNVFFPTAEPEPREEPLS
jgi:hypothetical protein